MSKQYESRVRRSEFSVKQLLRDEFCSYFWLLASYERKRDRRGRIWYYRKKGACPVAGMIRCSDCGRWSLPWHDDDLCTDCRTQRIVRDVFKRLKRWPRDDWPVLLKTWWRRPVYMPTWLKEDMPHLAVVTEADSGEMESPEVSVVAGPATDTSADSRFAAEDSPFADDDDSPIDESDLFDGHLEPDQRWGHTPGYHEVLISLRWRFRKRRKNKDGEWIKGPKLHGMGCTKVMLPETKKGLRKEIAHFRHCGEIFPSARRLHNPFDRYEYPLPSPGDEGVLCRDPG